MTLPDYTWEKVDDVIGHGANEKYVTPEFKKPRKYEVILTGMGEYAGYAYTPFVIKKAANPLAVEGKTVRMSSRKLSKKAQKLAVSRVLTFTAEGKGKIKYAGVSGSKKITINKKTGKVTVKKGLKKGNYKVKIKVKAGGNACYKAAAKTAKVTISVR